MKLSQLNYELPEKLIANSPTFPRDHAKLLVLDKDTGEISHKHFYDLPSLLTPNDVLVFNQTKVFPARLFGEKETGGKIEILLFNEIPTKGKTVWRAMHRGKLREGQKVKFEDCNATVLKLLGSEIEIEFIVNDFWEWLYAYGKTPIPPYIQSKDSEKELREEYQTVYAKDKGSVAAPTAGLHFTNKLIQELKDKGIRIEYVTLHVGAGTFLPIKETDITKHKMHSEYFLLDDDVAKRLNVAKKQGKRIISVGTTTTRVLETRAKSSKNKLIPGRGQTDIYIYPPYKFNFVDSLITNFHLPHSTLLALVSALVSDPNTKEVFSSFEKSTIGKAYMKAIKNNYKFYSFGDGMIIL